MLGHPSKDHLTYAAVGISAHDQQVGLGAGRRTRDCFAGIAATAIDHGRFGPDAMPAEIMNQPIQIVILAALLHH